MKKKKETGSVKDRSCPSRSPIYDESEERIIVRFAVKYPFDSLKDLENSTDVNPKAHVRTL